MALLMVQPRQRRARDRRDSLSPAELLRFLVTGSPTEVPGFTHDQAAALYAEYREQILDHEDRDDGRPVSWLVREFERDPEWRRRWLTDDLRELAELHEHYTRQQNAGAVAQLEQLIAGATDELAAVGRGETFTTSGNPRVGLRPSAHRVVGPARVVGRSPGSVPARPQQETDHKEEQTMTTNEVADTIYRTMANAAEAAEAERLRVVDERRAAVPPEIRAACHATGMRPNEIRKVAQDRRGIVVTPTTGPRLVLVSPDHPDAEGRSGLLLLDPSPGSLVPLYASRPRRRLGRPKPAPAPVAAPEPEAELDPRDAADAVLMGYRTELARLRTLIAEHEQSTDLQAPNEIHLLRPLVRHLEELTRARKAELRRDDPPPRPSEEMFHRQRAAILWARGVLDDNPEAYRLGVGMVPDMSLCPTNLAEHEFKHAVAFLEAHGEPMPEIPGVEPEATEVPPARGRRGRRSR